MWSRESMAIPVVEPRIHRLPIGLGHIGSTSKRGAAPCAPLRVVPFLGAPPCAESTPKGVNSVKAPTSVNRRFMQSPLFGRDGVPRPVYGLYTRFSGASA